MTSAVSGTTVTLSWTAAAGAPTSYIVEAGSASGLANLANSDLGGTTPSLTATNVGWGIYYVRVKAKNACGTSGPSNEVVVAVASSGTVTGTWRSATAGGFRLRCSSRNRERRFAGTGGTTGDKGGPDVLTLSGTYLNEQLTLTMISQRGVCPALFQGTLTSPTTLTGTFSDCGIQNVPMIFSKQGGGGR